MATATTCNVTKIVSVWLQLLVTKTTNGRTVSTASKANCFRLHWNWRWQSKKMPTIMTGREMANEKGQQGQYNQRTYLMLKLMSLLWLTPWKQKASVIMTTNSWWWRRHWMLTIGLGGQYLLWKQAVQILLSSGQFLYRRQFDTSLSIHNQSADSLSSATSCPTNSYLMTSF